MVRDTFADAWRHLCIHPYRSRYRYWYQYRYWYWYRYRYWYQYRQREIQSDGSLESTPLEKKPKSWSESATKLCSMLTLWVTSTSGAPSNKTSDLMLRWKAWWEVKATRALVPYIPAERTLSIIMIMTATCGANYDKVWCKSCDQWLLDEVSWCQPLTPNRHTLVSVWCIQVNKAWIVNRIWYHHSWPSAHWSLQSHSSPHTGDSTFLTVSKDLPHKPLLSLNLLAVSGTKGHTWMMLCPAE